MPRPSPLFVPNKRSPIDKTNLRICKRFKALRLSKGYTQELLADIFKVHKSTIKQIEIGMNMPTYEMLRKVKRHFRVSYDYLIDGKSF